MPIVVGHFNGRPRSERLCELCNLKDLGDEYYYLMKCDLFQSQLVKYMNDEHIQLGNTLDMKHVMNSENIEELKTLSQFVSIILKYFSEEGES